MTVAYRVQADDGRGPWRPGFSLRWIDGDAQAGRLMETVMDLMPIAEIRALPPTHHYGCACRSLDGLREWFTAIEMERLERLGFYPVRLNADLVIAESPWQMFIGRKIPFAVGASRLRWKSKGRG